MDQKNYRAMLFAVGSLPFWTGKKKLVRLLKGDPGSFWKGETPLKRVYLNQPFFGELSDLTESEIRQTLQRLLDANYLVRESISGDKPYLVVKFSDKGVKKYYNQLVLHEGMSEPFWWLHHVSRLRTRPNSRINSGGELLTYNDQLYLTQTPAYRSQTERVQSDQTLPIKPGPLDTQKGHYEFRGLRVETNSNPVLSVRSETNFDRVNAGDLGRKLSHFGSDQSQVNPPDPYVIQGRLIRAGDPDAESTRDLVFRNSDDDELTVIVKTNQVPDELSLREQERYVLGPVTEASRETNSEGDGPKLMLEQSGEIRPASY